MKPEVKDIHSSIVWSSLTMYNQEKKIERQSFKCLAEKKWWGEMSHNIRMLGHLLKNRKNAKLILAIRRIGFWKFKNFFYDHCDTQWKVQNFQVLENTQLKKMQRYAVQTKGAVMRILHSSLENAAKGDDSPVGNAEVVVHTESN